MKRHHVLFAFSLLTAACAEASVPPDVRRDAATDVAAPGADAATPGADATPGTDATAASGSVVINEINASGDEWVELYNTGATPFDLSGFGVTDSNSEGTGPREDHAARFPSGTVLPPRGYMLVVGNQDDAGAGLSTMCVMGSAGQCVFGTWGISASRGETMYLINSADAVVAQGNYPIAGAPSGRSLSRLPDGTGAFAAGTPTPGAANRAP